jgi:hypothetical protein
MQSQGGFAYREDEINKIAKMISVDRFSGYLSMAKGRRTTAGLLYERNTALSEALYGTLQGFEIPFRNAIDSVLSGVLGNDWYRTIRMKPGQQIAVQEAEDKISKGGNPVTHGRIVAQLSLGFWTNLISKTYEKDLWVKRGLYRAFPGAVQQLRLSSGELKNVSISRNLIHQRVDSIRILRNRIAHHERILQMALDLRYDEILEAIGWVCPTMRLWTESSSCFSSRFRSPIPQ